MNANIIGIALLCLTGCLSAQNKEAMISKPFPEITSTSLAGDSVTLPAKTAGQIALITVAFVEEGQAAINSWAEPFLETYMDKEGFAYYEVPMISEQPPLARNFIDSGMRAGLDEKMHPNVVTFYGDYAPYLSALQMTNLRSGYAFLIDQAGIIRFRGEGKMTPEEWKEMKAVISTLKI